MDSDMTGNPCRVLNVLHKNRKKKKKKNKTDGACKNVMGVGRD
jgi:hypothetical protein